MQGKITLHQIPKPQNGTVYAFRLGIFFFHVWLPLDTADCSVKTFKVQSVQCRECIADKTELCSKVEKCSKVE